MTSVHLVSEAFLPRKLAELSNEFYVHASDGFALIGIGFLEWIIPQRLVTIKVSLLRIWYNVPF